MIRVDLGVKRLTAESWNEIDPTNVMFGAMPIPEDLIPHIMQPQLSMEVPLEVAQLFEVARSAMCYGYFFYPLWTLAAEQLLRVGEAAVSARCTALDAASEKWTFNQKIGLIERRLPGLATSHAWHWIRRLRNEASHPRQQTIMSPGMAVPVVEGMAAAINQLFAAEVDRTASGGGDAT